MLFEKGESYERFKGKERKAHSEEDAVIYWCEHANEKGGLLKMVNTSREGEYVWVESHATNYMKIGTTVEDFLSVVAKTKRERYEKKLKEERSELEKLIAYRKSEIEKYSAKILEINKEYPQIPALSENSYLEL